MTDKEALQFLQKTKFAHLSKKKKFEFLQKEKTSLKKLCHI